MVMRAFLVFLSVLLLCNEGTVFGQQDIAEKMLEDQDDSSEQSELLEQIRALRDKPLDINKSSADALGLLPALTPQLSSNIVRYRQQNGPYHTVRDLLRVPGIDEDILSAITDLVKIKTKSTRTAHPEFQWRTRVSERIDRPVGFKDGTYQSSSKKIYNRAKFVLTKNIEGGFLLEKDAGESRFDDLRLFYAVVAPSRNISFMVGNYQLQAGQGLVLWSPYGFSKSSDSTLPLRKKARGTRGYLTVDENAALFGAALKSRFGWMDLTTFFSKHELDATPASNESVVSLFTSGLHRNETEKNKKDQLTETMLGGRIALRPALGLSLGLTFYRATFDKTIQKADPERSRFKFSGESNNLIGFDWTYSLQNIEIFGELARSRNGGQATLVGTRIHSHPMQLAFLYRNYTRDFQNFHAFGFGEKNGATQNERGYYAGIKYNIAPSTKLNAYYDIFKFPWRSFFQPLPVNGHDFLVQLEHRFDKRLLLTLRFREKIREETDVITIDPDRTGNLLTEKRQRQFRLQIDVRVAKQLALRSRIQAIKNRFNGFSLDASENNESGFLVYQDVKIQPSRTFRIIGRFTFFDTDSFDSRVFQYENDLPGVVTNRALFGQGARWYLLFGYKPLKSLSLNIKYSATVRNDTEIIGSGADRLEGNLDRRLALQLETKI